MKRLAAHFLCCDRSLLGCEHRHRYFGERDHAIDSTPDLIISHRIVGIGSELIWRNDSST